MESQIDIEDRISERVQSKFSENLKKAFSVSVAEVISQLDGKLIAEMALPLKEFKRRVDGLRFQLIENWCLCKWCQMFDPENDNAAHWRTEFRAAASNIRDFKIKGKSDKLKTIAKMFIADYDYNQPSKILEIIRDKFDAECIDSSSQRNKVAVQFASSVHSLINILSDNKFSIVEYIKVTFK